jgi:outer membrane biosynthesis protein TonB
VTFQVRAIAASAQSPVAVVGSVPESLPDALNHSPASQVSATAEVVQQEAAISAPAADAALQPKPAQERYGQFDYVPREFLSLAPKPLTNLEIPFPESVAGEFNIKAQLTLFIDESGYVQRVRVDGPALPPLLEEAAVNVFRQARFSPGQVGTQVVRSMIRIEVNFESQRLKPPRKP